MEALEDELPSIADLNSACDSLEIAETRAPYDTAPSDPRGFKRLKVWQLGMDFAVACYRSSGAFPASEQFGLTKQLRNAASSITLNIAEGWGRNSKAEFARFCDIARGSASEAESALELAVRLEYTEAESVGHLFSAVSRVSGMLLKLSKSLRSK